MQFYEDLDELSIDTDKFDYEKYKTKKNIKTSEDLKNVSNINSDSAQYIIIPEIGTSRNALCKIYNPKFLTKLRVEYSKSKIDQPWYSQLQILREAFLLRELKHPAIVKFIGLNLYNDKILFSSDDIFDEEEEEECNETNCNPTLFLEYTGMKSIQDILEKGKLNSKFNLVRRQICIIGITSAVRYLHKNNIVHRNLCPESIWLDKNFYPKIFDFSNSREFTPENAEQTNVTYNKTNQVRYQAPEIFNQSVEYQFLKSLDIFSLGRLLYLMLTGYEPFIYEKINSSYKVQEQVFNGIIPKFPNTISPEWQDLLESCWSINPSDRLDPDIIYNCIIEEDFLIAKFDKSEREKIIKYINLLKEYEDSNTYEATLEISKAGKFHADTLDTTEIIEANFKELDQILKDKTFKKNGKRFLELINEVVVNEQFFTEGYLPRVMNCIDRFLDNNFQATNFIKQAFGPKTKINKASKSIETLNISPETTTIPNNAFQGFENLKRVYIPNSVETIEDEAFCDCKKLEYVYLPNSIKDEELGVAVFKKCPRLNNITIPEDLIKIQDSTFEGDKKLKEIKLNSKLKAIGPKAFSDCRSLESIKIPESVTQIGKNAFQSCKKLNTIEFPGVSKRKIHFIKSGCKYSKNRRKVTGV